MTRSIQDHELRLIRQVEASTSDEATVTPASPPNGGWYNETIVIVDHPKWKPFSIAVLNERLSSMSDAELMGFVNRTILDIAPIFASDKLLLADARVKAHLHAERGDGIKRGEPQLRAIAVIGTSREEAAAYAEARDLPRPRVYLGHDQPGGAEGLIAIATVVTPDAAKLISAEMVDTCISNSVMTAAPGVVIGSTTRLQRHEGGE